MQDKPMLPTRTINHKYAPKEFLGLKSTNLLFLTTYPQIDFTYKSLINMCEIVEQKNITRSSKNQAKTIVRKANECIKNLKNQESKLSGQYKLDDGTIQNSLDELKMHQHNAWSALGLALKMSGAKELPDGLQVAYAALELKSIANRVCNRLESNYLYDDAVEKEVAKLMRDVGIDSILSNYIQAAQDAQKNQAALMIHTNSVISIFEYMLILFNKIEGGYSMHSFRYLPSETKKALESEFERIHEAA